MLLTTVDHLVMLVSLSALAAGWVSPPEESRAQQISRALTQKLEKIREYLNINSEAPRTAAALCEERGRACELHTARTQDGFLLSLVRVRGARRGATPVLVLHGNLASSDSWIMLRNHSDLGAALSDAGYDVWLGNFRGNTLSRRHARLSPRDPDFWRWSFHEIGLYDLPAMIDEVLRTTGSPSLHYLAHSLSTTAYLVMASTRTEYNAKVRSAHLMAPAIYMREGAVKTLSGGNRNSPFRPLVEFVESWLHRIGIGELAPRSTLIRYLGEIFCSDDSPIAPVCYAVYRTVFGRSDPQQRAPNLIATAGAYHPTGTSLQCIEHVRAVNVNGKFRPFGRGVNDPDPGPEYNISAISTPVALYYSDTDGAIDPKDVENLARQLPRLALKYEVPLEAFDHCDFMWARDAKELVYDAIIKTMRNVD